ncbi:major_cap_HK97, phage major capsid protein, HK97 family [uncultured Caudovirales phage]|uniref:Major_cap_HK97, phage major capsid protein, HK97 family n=1 Tax=uncultured Caudovirales phage TaxID=2100421 RepID=A0A6J5M8L9_9CAUD|nr:major_cap_HK97, phage major capsid protein, HK97 family [uncultured Caudovirales phage]
MEEMVKVLDEKLSKQKDALAAEVAAAEKKFADQVEKLNKELTAKDATIGQVQDEVRELREKNTALESKKKESKGVIAQVADFITEKGESFVGALKGMENGMMVKSVADMTSANLTGDQFHTYLDTQEGFRPMGQTRFRSLVRTFQSATDYVQFVRTATPAGAGSFARQASEGAAKNQVDYDFQMIDVTLTPIAGFATVSRQSLRNIPFLRSYLPQTMLEDLLDTEDQLFANSLFGAGVGSTTVSPSNNNIEKIVGYIKNLIKAKYSPNGIAISPDEWAEILLTTQSNAGYNLPNVCVVDTTGTVRILGRPVIPVNWLSGSGVIVGDWNKAAILESEGLRFAQADQHSDNFTKNKITFLLERTEELAVFRPDAFICTTL